jgi:hypothetical protein
VFTSSQELANLLHFHFRKQSFPFAEPEMIVDEMVPDSTPEAATV